MSSMNSKQVYISYSRRADYSFIKRLIAEQESDMIFFSCELKEEQAGIIADAPVLTKEQDTISRELIDKWDIIYDENSIAQGHSIKEFMTKLAGAEQIIILLSSGYFESPFCMYELMMLYEKGCRHLLPVIVFVGGYEPGSIKECELVSYWDAELIRVSEEGKVDTANLYRQFSNKLPQMLTWLVGKYDNDLEGVDTLFHAFSDSGENRTIFSDVFKALATTQLRYPFYSQSQKQNLIIEGIEKAIEWCRYHWDGDKELVEIIHEKVWEYLKKYDAIQSVSGGKAGESETLLKKIEDWLDEMKFANNSPEITLAIVSKIEVIIGLLLLDVVDDEKIFSLLHELNRQKNFAHVELAHENDCMFQILVSALSLSPAKFRWKTMAHSAYLKGDKELVMLERGINVELNLYQELQNDQKYNIIYRKLFSQVVEALSGSGVNAGDHSDDALVDAMCELSKGFYIPLASEKLCPIKNEAKFRSDLGSKLPGITQIITDSKRQNKVQNYLHDGWSSGKLFAIIFPLYSKIKELKGATNETRYS